VCMRCEGLVERGIAKVVCGCCDYCEMCCESTVYDWEWGERCVCDGDELSFQATFW
jgi:hypothetical protein